MKIAVIGGAGVRTPLLVGGLTGSDLPIENIALYDIDQVRLSAIGAVAARMASKGRVTLCTSLPECVAWADFVFTSIRVGGIEQRIHDEGVAQRHGIVGQETVGPAGFAMAMRTIPAMVQYARAIADSAPRSWIINFTNPVGMVTAADVKKIPRDRWMQTSLQGIMHPLGKMATVPPDMPVMQALEVMGREHVNELAVVSGGKLEGIFSRNQIARFLQINPGFDQSSDRAA